jgi:hypothetical protein
VTELQLEKGECTEKLHWKLIVPFEGESMEAHLLCSHVVILGAPIPQFRSDGSQWGAIQRFALAGGIVECQNEGGCNITQLCLKCIDEARKLVT